MTGTMMRGVTNSETSIAGPCYRQIIVAECEG